MRTGKCTVKRQLIRSLVVTLLNMSHVYVQTVLQESNGYVVKKPSDRSSSVICLIYSTICHVLCIRAYICHSYCTLQTSVYFQCGRNCSPLESPAEEQQPVYMHGAIMCVCVGCYLYGKSLVLQTPLSAWSRQQHRYSLPFVLLTLVGIYFQCGQNLSIIIGKSLSSHSLLVEGSCV